MKTFRYFFIALLMLALAPSAALAQDSLNVIIGGAEYGAWEANFGAQFTFGEDIGPLPLVPVEGDGTTAPADQGCDPLVNGDDVAGNIAWVSRGSCAFVLKVQNAAAAGAVAVVVHNDDRNEPPEDFTLVFMGGDCTIEGEPPAGGCNIPAAFVSYRSHLAIETDIKFGEPATLSCISEDSCVEPPPPPAPANIEGTTTQSTIFNDGFIGNDFSFGNGLGFTFNGEQGLFVGTALVGIGGDVTGNPYDGASEYETGTATVLSAPFADPFSGAEAGAQTTFSSANVDVTMSGYAYDGFIIYDMNVTNASGGPLDDVYLGMFADFDAGTTSVDDNAGFNAENNAVYVFDALEGTSYFGLASLTDDLSGYSADASGGDDAQLFDAMTMNVAPGADPAERATVVGAGPFDMAAGESKVIRFAIVAGADETALLANTAAADAIGGTVAVEETTAAGTFVLESAYPNPFSSKTTIGFELPTAQDVSLVVYDVLGREVAVLVDGTRQAGPQSVEFDAANLPSGVYVYRLEAGATQLSQQFTIVR